MRSALLPGDVRHQGRQCAPGRLRPTILRDFAKADPLRFSSQKHVEGSHPVDVRNGGIMVCSYSADLPLSRDIDSTSTVARVWNLFLDCRLFYGPINTTSLLPYNNKLHICRTRHSHQPALRIVKLSLTTRTRRRRQPHGGKHYNGERKPQTWQSSSHKTHGSTSELSGHSPAMYGSAKSLFNLTFV